MTNSPQPDPRRSSVSFDEWVAIFIALGTMGIILAISLVPKDRAWSFLSGLVTGETASQPIFGVKEERLGAFLPTQKSAETETRESRRSRTPAQPSPGKPEPAYTGTKSAQTQTPATSVLVPPTKTKTSETGKLPTATIAPETPALVISPAETITPEENTLEEPQVTTPVVPIPAPSVAQSPTPSPTASPTPEAETTTEPRFEDVPQDYWAYPYIVELADRGIISGVSAESFDPNRPITRQEFAFILEKAFQNQPILKESNFQDVDPEILSRLKTLGISQTNGFLSGYPENRFLPNENISRLHVLVALASGLNLNPSGDPANVLQVYQDTAQIPNYAREKIAATTEAGIVVNYPNPQQLNPNQAATRAEVAALIYQSLVSQGKAKQITSE